MSAPLTDTSSMPPARAAEAAAPLHQSSSETPAIHRPGWWDWLDRPFQRIALREIADDPRLLGDLGLSREEAAA